MAESSILIKKKFLKNEGIVLMQAKSEICLMLFVKWALPWIAMVLTIMLPYNDKVSRFLDHLLLIVEGHE